jgi:hypothetical protein
MPCTTYTDGALYIRNLRSEKISLSISISNASGHSWINQDIESGKKFRIQECSSIAFIKITTLATARFHMDGIRSLEDNRLEISLNYAKNIAGQNGIVELIFLPSGDFEVKPQQSPQSSQE